MYKLLNKFAEEGISSRSSENVLAVGHKNKHSTRWWDLCCVYDRQRREIVFTVYFLKKEPKRQRKNWYVCILIGILVSVFSYVRVFMWSHRCVRDICMHRLGPRMLYLHIFRSVGFVHTATFCQNIFEVFLWNSVWKRADKFLKRILFYRFSKRKRTIDDW